jgi:hypothetical protein
MNGLDTDPTSVKITVMLGIANANPRPRIHMVLTTVIYLTFETSRTRHMNTIVKSRQGWTSSGLPANTVIRIVQLAMIIRTSPWWYFAVRKSPGKLNIP